MPRYKNETDGPIWFGGIGFQPGEERSVNIFLPYAMLGLTKVSDEPLVTSPVLLCQSVTIEAGVSQTIDIPWGSDRISISAYARAGESATLKLGDSTIGIPIDDSSGGYVSPQGGYRWVKVNKLTLESEAGATVQLLVEGVA